MEEWKGSMVNGRLIGSLLIKLYSPPTKESRSLRDFDHPKAIFLIIDLLQNWEAAKHMNSAGRLKLLVFHPYGAAEGHREKQV